MTCGIDHYPFRITCFEADEVIQLSERNKKIISSKDPMNDHLEIDEGHKWFGGGSSAIESLHRLQTLL